MQDAETAQPATKRKSSATSSSDGESGSKDSSGQPSNATMADDNMSEASVAILHSDHDKEPRYRNTDHGGKY